MATQYRNRARSVDCPWGCGAGVLTFIDELGLKRYLDGHSMPVTYDLRHPSIKERVWQWREYRLGWCLLGPWELRRDHRPLRLEHQCAGTPKKYRKGS